MNLVVINKSLGEIDWISANRHKFDGHTIFINYRCDDDEIKAFLPNFYELESEKIFHGKKYLSNFDVVTKIDNILERLSTFIFNRTHSQVIQKLFDLLLVFVKKLIARIIVKSGSSLKPDSGIVTVFHENNDRNTVFLEVIKLVFKVDKVVFFPHHFGVTYPKNILTKAIHKLSGGTTVWVNRESESDGLHYIHPNENQCNLGKPRGNGRKLVLILTRQCSFDYGFDSEDAYIRLDSLLNKIQDKYRGNIYIKHHPRDKLNPTWKTLEELYDLKVLESSALDFCAKRNVICFHLYTTLVEPLSYMGVKCIDVSPYNVNPLSIPLVKENMGYYLEEGITELYDENEFF